MLPKTRVCRSCGKRRLIGLFFRNTGEGDGLRPECKPCTMLRRKLRRVPK